MTPNPVPHRWLATLLGVALLLDFLMNLGGGIPSSSLLALPGAMLFAICAYLGVDRPALGAVVGAGTLTVSSVLLQAADITTPSVGLAHILLTELISGAVLLVLVVWRCTPAVAAISVAVLVVSCVASVIIRDSICGYYYCEAPGTFVTVAPETLVETALVGFVLLVGGVVTGLYLRRAAKQRVETEMGALVRRQWPLGAALAVLALAELTQGGAENLPALTGSVGAAVCAFFGPKYPLRTAVLGAGAIAFGALLSILAGADESWPVSMTGLASAMALIAFAVRYTSPQQAAWSTAALVAATMLSLGLRGPRIIGDPNTMFVLLLLLVASIVAGWYFRGRDRERNQTVRAAVTSAQQGERMALARELHDVVAHHVTGIVVQAQAALLVADKNPDVAVPALEKIERSGAEALTAMRTLVGSLRDGTATWAAGSVDAPDQATTDLAADIHTLVENYTGPPVELELDLPDQLPHEVGRSVLRLVQESLTNVGKHAPDASAARVRVANNDEWLHIRVTDDGTMRPAAPAGGSGGYGLVGMRERVELLGGRFEAGPSGYVGWSVEAWLPLRKEGS